MFFSNKKTGPANKGHQQRSQPASHQVGAAKQRSDTLQHLELYSDSENALFSTKLNFYKLQRKLTGLAASVSSNVGMVRDSEAVKYVTTCEMPQSWVKGGDLLRDEEDRSRIL